MPEDITKQPRRHNDYASVDDVDGIRYEVDNRVGHVVIDRPEKSNAVSFDMADAIVDAIQRAEVDDEVKVIVLRGEGGNFCSGHDLSEVYKVYEAYDGDDAGERRPSMRARLHFDQYLVDHYRDVLYAQKPIVSRVDGWCVGAGMGLNICCDVSIAAESAKFSHREQRLTFAGGSFISLLEYVLLGPRKPRELSLTGETISGSDAERIGYANAVVPDDELDDEVERYCEAIKLLPMDGIVMGSTMTNLAYDIMGVDQALNTGMIGHTLSTNIRFDEDDYNFIGTRGKEDTGEAIRRLHERFDDLGFN